MNVWGACIKNVTCAATLGIKLQVEVVIFVAAFCKIPIVFMKGCTSEYLRDKN